MVSLAPKTPFAVRACRPALLLAPALILALGASGCGHRRTAMRPVFGTPVQAAPVLTAPAAVSVPAVDASCPTGSTMTTVPSSADPFVTPSAVNVPAPIVAPAGGGSPPAPEVAPEQPTLTPPGISSIRPTSSRVVRKPAASRTSRPSPAARAALRDRVKPFVEIPEDLFAPPKADRPWQYVVVHHSANAEGSLAQVDRDHRKVLGFEGCGYHFVIGNGTDSPDGQIEVADRWLNQKHGVHCRNGKSPEVNEYGIAICLVGNFDQSEPTAKQVAAAKALVAYLADRYQIAGDHVGAHDQFADGPTACPGKNFPAEAIFGTRHVAQR